MTCPNRDAEPQVPAAASSAAQAAPVILRFGGPSDFRAAPYAKRTDRQKRPVHKYIAYFQAYTNTYAPVEYLERIFLEAISDPEVVALSIATRPDCLGDEVLALLHRLNRIKPVWVELGLQTIHEDTARFIRRGYPLSCFSAAVTQLRAIGIEVIVHVILGLPGEDRDAMLQTCNYLNTCDIQGIKLQLLHILKHTDLATYYTETGFLS
ncbi:MAG: TIGR01212 family radical SAM protein [Lachnospiraceae bacterium]